MGLKNNSNRFVLIDLERTLGTGQVHFWNQNKFGYTTYPAQVGSFSKVDAYREVTEDFDRMTVGVLVKKLKEILVRYSELEGGNPWL